MMKQKVLNLYAGLGGNSELWDEELYDITHVELNEKIAAVLQRRKPNQKVIVADAHEYLRLHADEYDIIWGSRPCQSHTRMMKFTRHKHLRRYPDFGLYEEIVFLQNFFKGKWIIENVVPYYVPLIAPTAKIGRHLFWSNFDIQAMDNEPKSPANMMNLVTVGQKKIMMDWLGIHYDENIYYEKNHCPVQILRNCVHPLLGQHIIKCANL